MTSRRALMTRLPPEVKAILKNVAWKFFKNLCSSTFSDLRKKFEDMVVNNLMDVPIEPRASKTKVIIGFPDLWFGVRECGIGYLVVHRHFSDLVIWSNLDIREVCLYTSWPPHFAGTIRSNKNWQFGNLFGDRNNWSTEFLSKFYFWGSEVLIISVPFWKFYAAE